MSSAFITLPSPIYFMIIFSVVNTAPVQLLKTSLVIEKRGKKKKKMMMNEKEKREDEPPQLKKEIFLKRFYLQHQSLLCCSSHWLNSERLTTECQIKKVFILC